MESLVINHCAQFLTIIINKKHTLYKQITCKEIMSKFSLSTVINKIIRY